MPLPAARVPSALAILLFACAPASAQSTPRTITVDGHGEASGRPDSASISAGVVTQAHTAADALAANAAAMNNIFAVLRRQGVAEKNIQTSNFNVEPQYAPYSQANTDRQRIVGYQVSDQVTVKLERIAGTGPVIDALVAAGANQMNAIAFSIRDPAPLLDEARAAAVDDAVRRAAVLARAAHVSLGPILDISESNAFQPRPIFQARAMIAGAAPPPTPIATGEEELSANVSITWEIQ